MGDFCDRRVLGDPERNDDGMTTETLGELWHLHR
jgi:hypothetical protein